MGWTTTNKKHDESIKDFFKREFVPWEILDCAVVNFTEVYLACRRPNKENVFAVVCLINKGDGKNSFFNFGYKDMTENEHPYYHGCPERILNLLSPTENEYAKEWRQICRKLNAEKKIKPKIADKSIIKFKKPITFQNGAVHDTFTIIKLGRKIRFEAENELYIITNWRKRDYSIAN